MQACQDSVPNISPQRSTDSASCVLQSLPICSALDEALADFNQSQASHFHLPVATQQATQQWFITMEQTAQNELASKQKKWEQRQAHITQQWQEKGGAAAPPSDLHKPEPYLDPATEKPYTLKHTFEILKRIPAYLLTDSSFDHFFIAALWVAVKNIQSLDGIKPSQLYFKQLFTKNVSELAAWEKCVLITLEHRIPVQPTQAHSPVAIEAIFTDDEEEANILASESMIHRIVRLNHLDCLAPFITPESLNAKDGFGQTPLMVAAALGYSEIVKYLLAQNAELHGRSHCPDEPHHGLTALDWAALKSHSQVVTLLQQAGASQSIDYDIPTWRSLRLYETIRTGSIAAMTTLLDQGIDLEVFNRYGSPLDLAFEYGHIEIAQYFLKRGFTCQQTHRAIKGKNIHQLLADNALAAAQLLLNHNPSLLEVPDQRGFTPLLNAATYGHTDIVRLLLQRGANLQQTIPKPHHLHGANALDRAIFQGHMGTAQVFKQHGLKPTYQHTALGPFAFEQLLMANQWAEARLLIELNPSLLNAYSRDGFNPLLLAAYYGHHAIAQALLSQGADRNASLQNPQHPYYQAKALDIALAANQYQTATLFMQQGLTARYHYTMLNGCSLEGLINTNQIDLVKLLLYVNPSLVNSPNWQGFSPLLVAACYDRSQIALWLIQKGADIKATAYLSQPYPTCTALDIALINKHYETATILMLNGLTAHNHYPTLHDWSLEELIRNNKSVLVKLLVYVNRSLVNGSDPQADPPLLLAASLGHTDIALCLIGHGATLSVRSPKGMTAVDLALLNGYTRTAQALQRRGVKATPSLAGATIEDDEWMVIANTNADAKPLGSTAQPIPQPANKHVSQALNPQLPAKR